MSTTQDTQAHHTWEHDGWEYRHQHHNEKGDKSGWMLISGCESRTDDLFICGQTCKRKLQPKHYILPDRGDGFEYRAQVADEWDTVGAYEVDPTMQVLLHLNCSVCRFYGGIVYRRKKGAQS